MGPQFNGLRLVWQRLVSDAGGFGQSANSWHCLHANEAGQREHLEEGAVLARHPQISPSSSLHHEQEDGERRAVQHVDGRGLFE